jgi:RNA polymerase sigma factor (sigma-70 family)
MMSNPDRWKNIEALLQQSGWLTGLARQVVASADLASDAVQETWIACLDQPPPQTAPARAWLGGVLRNRVRMRLRGERRRRRHEQEAAALPAPSAPTAEAALERLQAQRLLADAVAALPEPYRSTVVLRHFEGLSAEEIARGQGVPAGTVRWRLKEALDRLRGTLDERHGGDRRAWLAVLGTLDVGSDGVDGAASARRSAGSSTPIPATGDPGLGPTSPRSGTVPPLLAAARVAAGLVLIAGVALIARSWNGGASAPPAVPPSGARATQGPEPGLPRLAAAVAPENQRGRLAGQVFDQNGKPVVGAVVLLVGSVIGAGEPPVVIERLVRSAAEGGFAFDDVPRGHYFATATQVGLQPAFRGESFERAAPRRDDFHLRLGPPGPTLSGEVRDEGGGPLVGAWVLAQRRSGAVTSGTRFVAVTDGTGRFELSLSPDAYRVSARAEGYARQSEEVSVTRSQTRDFQLSPAARVAGSVVDGRGAPVVGAVVTLEDGPGGSRRGETDAHGAFAFDDVQPGRYRLVARAAGGLVGQSPVQVEAAARLSDRKVTLAPGAVVIGRVSTRAGAPGAGAELRLHRSLFDLGGGTSVGVSAADGRFRITGLLPGAQVLAVAAPGLAPDRRELVLGEGVEALAGVDFALPPAAALTGQIVGRSGAPLARALVQVWVMAESPRRVASFARIRSDAEGRFRLDGLAPGQLRVQGEAPEGLAVVGPELLTAGENRQVRLALAPGSVISGRVRLASGAPAVGVPVMAQGQGVPFPRSAVTVANGSFELGRFASGEVRVIVSPPRVQGQVAPRALIRDLNVDGAKPLRGVELRFAAAQ